MASPLPGMDPYLEDERLWPEFQQALVEAVKESLQPMLPPDYDLRSGERRYSVEMGTTPEKQCCEPFVEIYRKNSGQLITLLEVVSPWNRTTSAGRESYLAKRRQVLSDQAGVVEIDLVMSGEPMLSYSRNGLPEFDYSVTVNRSSALDRYEIYTSVLEMRLPKFKVPLAPSDRDLLLDLQAMFDLVYDQGRFGERIEYCRNPSIPLSESRAAWLNSVLHEKGFRNESTQDQIALAAYFLWEKEGCPTGRAEEHWHKAKEQLWSSKSTNKT